MFRETLKDIWPRFARWWCWLFCVTFFRIRFHGLENIPSTGPFVLAVNHQSFLDPLFAGVALKRVLCFMARDTLFKNWFFGPLLLSVNAIPVRRGQADIASIRTIIARLKEGRGVCLFPEATRTSDGKIAPFKAASLFYADAATPPLSPSSSMVLSNVGQDIKNSPSPAQKLPSPSARPSWSNKYHQWPMTISPSSSPAASELCSPKPVSNRPNNPSTIPESSSIIFAGNGLIRLLVSQCLDRV
jgi:1-acyl-sn-glycerol-3-phosphate acyltransferase